MAKIVIFKCHFLVLGFEHFERFFAKSFIFFGSCFTLNCGFVVFALQIGKVIRAHLVLVRVMIVHELLERVLLVAQFFNA